MADEKLTQLTPLDAFATGDLLYVVDDPAGTPVSKKATIEQVQDYVEGAANTFTAKQTIDLSGEQLALGGTNTGVMSFAGSSSGKVTVQAASAAGTYTLTLPTSDGDSGQFLQTDGSGVLSWDDAPVTSPAGSDTQLQFNDAGSFGGDAGLTFDKTSNALTIGAGSLKMTGSSSGTVTIQPAAAAGTYSLTLPTSDGDSGQFLKTDGSGVLSWDAPAVVTPGGSDTQVQFNDGGAFGADGGFTFNKTAKTLTLGGATVTTSSPVLDLSQTWNNGAVTFTGLKFNATDTASAAGSLLMDLQVGGSSRFSVSKTGILTMPAANIAANGDVTARSYVLTGGNVFFTGGPGLVNFFNTAAIGWRNISSLRLGFADTSASATVTITIAAPGVVTWTNHGLSTGSPVIFSTTGALPTGITAGTTYYAVVVDANSFQIATSFANAIAATPTVVTTSGSQSGTHAGRRGAAAQTFGVQDVLSTGSPGLENIDGADFVIRGSRSIGNKPGGSIVFQVAPAGASGTAQNALATALTIDSSLNTTVANNLTAVRLIATGANSSLSTTYFGSKVNIQGIINGISLASDSFYAFHNAAAITGTVDLILARDAANTLAQRNGTNAQTFRVYNTFTDASNYERGKIEWASNVLRIGTENAGTGTARNLAFQVGGTDRLDFGISVAGYWSYPSNTTSKTGFIATNANSSGASSFAAYKNGSLLTNCEFGYWNSTRSPYGAIVSDCGYIYANSANGFVIAQDNGPIVFAVSSGSPVERVRITTAGLVTFGGITSSFPALKRSSASLIVRLADDTANAALESASLKTDAPTGGTSGTWKLGVRVAATTLLDTTQYIEVDIGGTLYKVALVTT
jgi:hypothetical protein